MKNYLRVSLAAAGICVIFLSYAEAADPLARENTLAPDFSLEDTQGETVTLSSYRDKQPVLMFFWTTWCPFCRKELKVLIEETPGITKSGGKLLVVNVGESAAKVNSFLKANSLDLRVLLDKDTRVAGAFGIMGVPTFILINKKGRVVEVSNYFPRTQLQQILSE